MMHQEVRQSKFKRIIHDVFVFPFYILTHPFKGYEDFKFEKKGQMYVSVIYLVLMVLSAVLTATARGFLVRDPWDETFNLGRTALLIIAPIILFTVGNWSITTLFDGKGKLKEIFMVLMYGLIPYIWLSIPATLLSNFLVNDEVALYYSLLTVGTVLAAYMVFMGLLVTHEFGLLKTILTLLATLVAIAVIIFIGVLILTIFQQLYVFLKAIYEELTLRMR